MENKEVPFTQKDCKFLLAVKDKNFVQSLPEMKSNEEVRDILEEMEQVSGETRGITGGQDLLKGMLIRR